jgi:PelA/Pel-15E family pectate lyase
VLIAAGFLTLIFNVTAAPEGELTENARAALHRAAVYLTSIATRGGYVWEYTLDLKRRWGEGEATESQIWVQPPGTPSVGMALLRAWQATGDPLLRQAAEAAGDALIWGQLECGGWAYSIDFSPEGEKRWYYRHLKGTQGLDTAKLRNYGTFDDDTSQSATSLLIALSSSTKEYRFREASEYALEFMLRAQYPNGGWPQVFPPKGLEDGYWNYYTFNDGAINDVIRVMLEAWRAYGERKYLEAAKRGGDFIILSQGKPPQAGWAQQYNMALEPAWARKFEPPSWCSAVAARNIRTLVALYLETGDERYLRPIPAAIEWLNASAIGDGKWARFYEIGTNRPLYFTRDYKLTYSDADCPTHYSFQGSYGIPEAIAYYERVREMGRDRYLEETERKGSQAERLRRARQLEERVVKALAWQDPQGRWATEDRVRMRDFVQNIELLASYLECLTER